jgi:hypothetical protein
MGLKGSTPDETRTNVTIHTTVKYRLQSQPKYSTSIGQPVIKEKAVKTSVLSFWQYSSSQRYLNQTTELTGL